MMSHLRPSLSVVAFVIQEAWRILDASGDGTLVYGFLRTNYGTCSMESARLHQPTCDLSAQHICGTRLFYCFMSRFHEREGKEILYFYARRFFGRGYFQSSPTSLRSKVSWTLCELIVILLDRATTTHRLPMFIFYTVTMPHAYTVRHHDFVVVDVKFLLSSQGGADSICGAPSVAGHSRGHFFLLPRGLGVDDSADFVPTSFVLVLMFSSLGLVILGCESCDAPPALVLRGLACSPRPRHHHFQLPCGFGVNGSLVVLASLPHLSSALALQFLAGPGRMAVPPALVRATIHHLPLLDVAMNLFPAHCPFHHDN
ncbi:hypothetical protein ONZ45_g16347 [Pleurotus djamor]|nr:hypothetical protein ONZ45_g16347 [Pleurotus djamor]